MKQKEGRAKVSTSRWNKEKYGARYNPPKHVYGVRMRAEIALLKRRGMIA